jgi:diacylglycerol O-acyltransferase / wax synthase
MHRLSNLDASFLHLESTRTPMHIGCILTFSSPESGEMSFERFKSFIESRLPISPIFRRKIATQVFNIDRPAWVEDENFDINEHIFEASLSPAPYEDHKQEIIRNFFSATLDQSRPLWEILFVRHSNSPSKTKLRAADDQEFYALLKFHHAAVDGMSAEKILSGLLSPEKGTPAQLKDSWKPKSTPLSSTAAEITGKHVQNAYRSPNKLIGLARRLGHSVLSSQALRMLDKQQRPPNFFEAPETPFNHGIGKHHDFASAHLSLDKIKSIRKAYPGSTINDVVLAICSGALRAHLDNQENLPTQSLVAMIPVSKRAKDSGDGNTKKENGNLISPMLVSLATDLDTPLERIGMIHQNTLRAKEFNHKVAVERIMKHLPSWSTALTIKAYTKLRLANLLKPVFNLIITNVPGPRVPLYLDGARLKTLEGIAPIVDNMGLTMVVTSYIDTLTISMTSCESMADQTHLLVGRFEEALDELYHDLVADTSLAA